MANVKINELSELSSPEDDDILLIEEYDTGTYETKHIKYSNLVPQQYIYLRALAEGDSLSSGSKMTFTFPFNCNVVEIQAAVKTASTSGAITVDVHNIDHSSGDVSMLSTKVTIDQSEYSSYTAATPSVINTSYDDISPGDRIRIDVDGAGSGAAGLDVIMKVQRT